MGVHEGPGTEETANVETDQPQDGLIRVRGDLHHRLKLAALEQRVPLKTLVEAWLERELEGKAPIIVNGGHGKD